MSPSRSHTLPRLPGSGRRAGPVSVPGLASFLAGAVLTLLCSATSQAQETGEVAGSVLEEETLQPISQVQVYLPGTPLGTLSRDDGSFVLSGVEPGEYEVRFERIGYAVVNRAVTVRAGETAEVEVRLQQEVLGLDELVVTGTAGGARRREVGNTIEQINVDDIDSSPTGVDQILQGRAAGVSVLPSSGVAGSGAQIRLRGNVSVAMSNQPLIYIDGVRIRSEGYPENSAELLDRDIRGPNDAIGALGDINPNDIERFEVIKGSAATTLYGTEAAAGVIQIFTKRGESGTPRWTAQTDQGANWIQKFGTEGAPYLNMDPYLRSGHTQNYSLSVQGGTAESARYFVSSAYEDNTGVLPNDYQDKWSIRGNLGFEPLSDLRVQWNTSYIRNSIQNTTTGNNAQGITYNAYTQPAGFVAPEDIPRLLDYEVTSDIARFITGGTFEHEIGSLSNRLTIGYDRSDLEQRNLRPFGFISAPDGIIQVNHWSNEILTVDYASTLGVDLTGDLSANLSWGAQSTKENTQNVISSSRNFPGPGLPTVSSGSEQASAEERLQVINAGFFVQSLFDLSDRYFLTVGMRVDGNSAFGDDFGLQAYPKASLSYVVSDETFWPESAGNVKLRAAFGESGRAPGVFDAVRTWNPVGWGGDPALETLQVGNPNLGPERTRELELGLDASFFSDRLQTEFTYYRQQTLDALLPVRQIPSQGFTGSQLENVGELQNRGLELTLNTTPIEREALTADLGLTVSTNHSDVADLGTATEFSLGQEGWAMEGHPVPVMWAPRIMNPDEFAEPVIEMDHFGPNVPTHTIGLSGEVQFANQIRLSALGEYMGGHYIKNRAFRTMAQRKVAPQCSERGFYDALEQGQEDEVTAFWRVACTPELVDGRMFITPADFFKLRSVSLRLPLPFAIPAASDAMLSVSGHNLFQARHDDLRLLDPEMAGNTGMHGQVREIVETIPPASRFVASLRVTF